MPETVLASFRITVKSLEGEDLVQINADGVNRTIDLWSPDGTDIMGLVHLLSAVSTIARHMAAKVMASPQGEPVQ